MPSARMTIPISSPPRRLLANCKSSITPATFCAVNRLAESRVGRAREIAGRIRGFAENQRAAKAGRAPLLDEPTARGADATRRHGVDGARKRGDLRAEAATCAVEMLALRFRARRAETEDRAGRRLAGQGQDLVAGGDRLGEVLDELHLAQLTPHAEDARVRHLRTRARTEQPLAQRFVPPATTCGFSRSGGRMMMPIQMGCGPPGSVFVACAAALTAVWTNSSNEIPRGGGMGTLGVAAFFAAFLLAMTHLRPW